MSKEMLAQASFTESEMAALEAGGFDLSKILQLVQQLGPVVVPVIQSVLAKLPQQGWVPVVEMLLAALFTPAPK